MIKAHKPVKTIVLAVAAAVMLMALLAGFIIVGNHRTRSGLTSEYARLSEPPTCQATKPVVNTGSLDVVANLSVKYTCQTTYSEVTKFLDDMMAQKGYQRNEDFSAGNDGAFSATYYSNKYSASYALKNAQLEPLTDPRNPLSSPISYIELSLLELPGR